MAEYEQRQKELEDDRTECRILERLVEIKTGAQVSFPKLADLSELWAAIPRRKEPNPKHVANCRSVMRRFADFAATHQEGVAEFVAVKPETAAAFMAAEEARGLTPKTWNDTLKLLRSTFSHLHPDLPFAKNPFRGHGSRNGLCPPPLTPICPSPRTRSVASSPRRRRPSAASRSASRN